MKAGLALAVGLAVAAAAVVAWAFLERHDFASSDRDRGSSTPAKVTTFLDPLAPRQPLVAQLAVGEEHRYRIMAAANQFLQIVVEQQGIDLVATLVSPRGQVLLEVDHPTGDRGPERVCTVVDRAGEYQLHIKPWQASATGDYRIELVDRRPLQAGDELCRRALDAFLAAEDLAHQEGSAALQRAIELYGEAENTWQAWGQVYQQAVARRQIAQTWGRLGEVTLQMEAFRRALALAPAAARPFLEVDLRNEIGYAHYLGGEPQQALAAYDEARQLAVDEDYERGEATSLNNLALLYKSRGELERALSWYERAQAVWRALADRQRQATTLHNLGVTFTSLGRPRDALDALEEALTIRRQEGGRRAQASTLTAIGWARLQAGEIEQAVVDLTAAIELRRAAGDRRGEAITRDRLGTAYLQQGDLAAALASFEQARTLLAEVGDQFSLAHVITNIGWLYVTWQRPEAALRHFTDAVARLRRLGDADAEAYALLGWAHAERQRGRLEMAVDRADEALAKIESLRAGAGSQRLRSSFLASRQDAFALAVDLLMELEAREPGQGHAVRAFATSERGRARGLLDQLHAARVAGQQEIEEIQEQLNAVDRQRRRWKTAVDDSSRRAELDRRQRRLLLAIDRLSSPDRQALVSGQTATLAQIRGQLDEQTLLLAYSLGEKRSYVWAIDHSSWESHVLPARAELEESARFVYENLAAGSGRRSRTQAELLIRALSDLLLKPVAPRLATAGRLVIVTDGLLQMVPFSVLVDPRDPAAGPLVVRHEVVNLPSAAVLIALAERAAERPPASRMLAVVADPVFAAADPRVESGRIDTAAEGVSEGAEFPRLPFSRSEAEAILRLVPVGQRLALLDFSASREAVLGGELAGYRVVHFATHGVLHEEHPELSGIVLSGVREEGRRRDGMLRLHEIARLDLPAELVVLSACRTALGHRVRGEGLVGLTRGFLAAGTSRLVVSLWSVRDRATARLMQHFYQGLFEQGLAPAAALRRAQLWMLDQTDLAAPYFWAGFVFQGDWRAEASLFTTSLFTK